MPFKTSLLLAAGAAGLLLTVPASAQPREQITVTAPHLNQRSPIGAPIIDVAMTREVRFDDLNLRTRHGARELRSRVGFAAKTLCQSLDNRYPAPNNDRCMEVAYRDAIVRADDAIAAARATD